jgi:hypothetical protein
MAAHDALQIRDCMGRFSALDVKVATVEQIAVRLDNEIFNHDGGDGLKTIVLKRFAAEDREKKVEKEFRDLRDKETKEALLAHEKIIKDALDAKNASDAKALNLESVKTAKRGLVWQIAGVLASIASVCVAVLMLVCTWYVIHHASIDPPELFRQLQTRQTYTAHNQPQYAGGILNPDQK